MAKLKPCPFCGGEADILEHQFYGLSPTYGVKCLDCNCETFQFFETDDEAIAAWNTRVKEGDDNG